MQGTGYSGQRTPSGCVASESLLSQIARVCAQGRAEGTDLAGVLTFNTEEIVLRGLRPAALAGASAQTRRARCPPRLVCLAGSSEKLYPGQSQFQYVHRALHSPEVSSSALWKALSQKVSGFPATQLSPQGGRLRVKSAPWTASPSYARSQPTV